jgi:hypothetical protein
LALAALLAVLPAHAFTVPVPDFDRLEIELRLRPAQKAQYQLAVGATKRALMSVAIAGLQVKERLSQEIAKPVPDLDALYRLHEEAVELAAPNFREAADEWSRLYAMMDERQVAIAKAYLRGLLPRLMGSDIN